MTNILSNRNHGNDRPLLYRSDHQPNLLEYIDTTLSESFSLDLTIMRTISHGYDQYGNTILDQYLLYLLCQKVNPTRLNVLTKDLYHLLHQLIILNGKISKSFFEYSLLSNNPLIYQNMFNSYTNFIWNEFDINVLLELGCFLLKYRLCDIFNLHLENDQVNKNFVRRKILGYFLEIIGIYYLSSNHREFFKNSRSVDMIFPSPILSLYLPRTSQIDDNQTFQKFLNAIHDNGEIDFNFYQITSLLKSDAYRFLNKKLENKMNDFMTFIDTNIGYRQRNSCRTLKSLCRLTIKMHIKQFPTDIKQLSSVPLIDDQLRIYLIYQNKLNFEL